MPGSQEGYTTGPRVAGVVLVYAQASNLGSGPKSAGLAQRCSTSESKKRAKKDSNPENIRKQHEKGSSCWYKCVPLMASVIVLTTVQ